MWGVRKMCSNACIRSAAAIGMPGKISSSAHVAFELFGVIFDGALIGQNLSLFTIYLLETSNDIFKNFAHILHHHIGVSH